MIDVKFVDELPTTTHGRNSVYEQFRKALRARPGVWAQHPTTFKSDSSASAAAGNINRNATSQWGGFEAAVRSRVVYVRFNGTEGKSA